MITLIPLEVGIEPLLPLVRILARYLVEAAGRVSARTSPEAETGLGNEVGRTEAVTVVEGVSVAAS